ncbi:TetR/AcrR family transcriptional regulator [Pontibacillus yanchengensis]|uniref:TetR family transcriptional regulator n=1 Tax=Pontibacillus yanchengensis Y32 TaxID=1385514 RepID=A0A0A2TD22_9BACI|nr:TetR/AcrR family transcriptional regulator [Pontibacillus yanchengensis]KGP73429.1 TetR family transcriptional regulator [Pontibacillus yanchengensis Y32]
MYANFEKLPEEKKQAILSVCIEEFSDTGFEKTSTDRITSRAGISKGILFHYFKNKKNLFLYIVDYCRQQIGDQIMKEIKEVRTEDFFERVKEVILIKQRVQIEYYRETQLVTYAVLHPPAGMEEEMKHLLQKNVDYYSEEYLNKLLDKDLLQEHASPEKVVNLTMMALEQITNKYVQEYQANTISLAEIQQKASLEIDEYLKLIKYGCMQSDT